MVLTPQHTRIQGVNETMDLITSTRCKWDHGLDLMDLITRTGCKWDHGFDHKYRLGVNGTMDLITSTGCKWDHGFDHTYRD